MSKPKLSADDIDHIVHLLTSWRDKLTWDLLVDKVIAVLGRKYSRQALDAHEEIGRAFKLAKDRAREDRAEKDRRFGYEHHETSDKVLIALQKELAIALETVDSLRAEVVLLKREKNAFLETFATWLYNARNRRMTEKDLNLPLPEVERDRTA
ncbi:MAG: hypothetical protein EOR68_03790 [Mesorhizobium sp.]|uniref:hypothetical protein n=1 Tax=Mesorhizobium sp. TaxID=1871066 RepID=UPI000FE91554|nr:hypothetical protein [Mesorhizobium sp.]RWM04338.1 MAG: hypothetical protein EOR68_03790 [Mesorhizobium sp.]TIP51678.1 MAG: hypothetical protein E5X77_00700 [Mesorhizobium sp.]